jgi:hypothetical protein
MEGIELENFWEVECIRAGQVVWRQSFYNLVVTAGLNKVLDATFKTGLSAPTWFIGLVNGTSTPTFDATDIMSSHTGWTSDENYSGSTRPAFTPGTISGGAVDNSSSKASFTISAASTIAGCFLTDGSSKSGTTGTLYAVGAFDGGSQAVVGGDVLNVTVTLSAAQQGAGGFMPIKEQTIGEYHP